MLIKNIFGTFILLFNTAGLGYLFFLGSKTLMKRLSLPKGSNRDKTNQSMKKQTIIQNNNIVPDEDDLLKDMDLSDFDNLNLDDFE
ncbi:MAG: hypothetical protein B6230_05820 [Desulfobacteraceae bacterium 4572_89]|nr:MAG: hypothetical protein B6230_05820 [Desulfobacteraceae bacterium 4572_89]